MLPYKYRLGLYIAGIAFVTSLLHVNAVVRPITPECRVRGVIESVQKGNAYDEQCSMLQTGCPKGVMVTYPARMLLSIKVLQVVNEDKYAVFNSCKEVFPVGQRLTVSILLNNTNAKSLFLPGFVIEGIVKSLGSPFLSSYKLSVSQDFFSHNLPVTLLGVLIIILIAVVLPVGLFVMRHNSQNRSSVIFFSSIITICFFILGFGAYYVYLETVYPTINDTSADSQSLFIADTNESLTLKKLSNQSQQFNTQFSKFVELAASTAPLAWDYLTVPVHIKVHSYDSSQDTFNVTFSYPENFPRYGDKNSSIKILCDPHSVFVKEYIDTSSENNSSEKDFTVTNIAFNDSAFKQSLSVTNTPFSLVTYCLDATCASFGNYCMFEGLTK